MSAAEVVSTTTTIAAPATDVFAVLADPSTHPAIDGTGWVRRPGDDEPITAAGQVFRMAMYHPNHPDGDYEMHNEVLDFDPPRAISWRPGYRTDDGLGFGGWIWRYDLVEREPGRTEVTLSYDWSAITDEARAVQSFPPFPLAHLERSLEHLGEIVTG